MKLGPRSCRFKLRISLGEYIMKKKVLLSSILTIAICLCLIAGSTFALFTSKSEVNIAATAGKVNVQAGLTDPILYSVQPDTAGTIADENGALYSYVEQTNGTFANSGTATLNEGTLTLDRITPGDKVEFSLTNANESNVAIWYRYTVQCVSGYELMSGLNVTIGQTTYTALDTYVSAWAKLEKDDMINPLPIVIELPVDAGNEYQGKSVEINVLVEAVQGNAAIPANNVESVTYLTVDTTDGLLEALASDRPYVKLSADLVADANGNAISFGDLSNKTIDANGNILEIALTGKLENVVLENIADNGDKVPAVNLAGASGDVTIKNSTLYDMASVPYGAIAGGSENLDITIDGCTVEGDRPVYSSGSINSLTLVNSVIKNTGSWGVLYNGTVYGDIVIDGCTFENCVGIFKAGVSGSNTSGAIESNVTITNNKFIDCTMKNNVYMDIAPIYGKLIFTGNTMTIDGETKDVTAADMLGIDLTNLQP